MSDPLPPSQLQGMGTPRWVKVFGLVAALFAVAFVVLHLTGHGMGHEHHMHHSGEMPAPSGQR